MVQSVSEPTSSKSDQNTMLEVGAASSSNTSNQNEDYTSDNSDLFEPYADSSESYLPSNSSSEDEEIAEEGPNEPSREKKRRKKADKTLWHRSVVKQKRLTGMKYVNRSRKEVAEKNLYL